MNEPWTEDSVARTLINPNYCLTDPPVVTEEEVDRGECQARPEDGC